MVFPRVFVFFRRFCHAAGKRARLPWTEKEKRLNRERKCFTHMKSTGIVRRVDELGRIVLPIELRRTLNIAEKDSLEIYVDGSSIMLKKYQPACIFCDSAKEIVSFHGKNVCPKCIRAMQALPTD